MTKLIKILPVLAIVAGIGGAFGFSAQQDPCEERNHIGYEYTGEGEPSGDPEGQEDLRELGKFTADFGCDESSDICHWVYLEDENEWIPCEGDLVE